MRTRRLAVLLTLAFAAGCQGAGPANTAAKPKPAASSGATVVTPPAAGVVYTGIATAPSGIVASGGGNIIGGNASAIVASGGGNRRVLATAEHPLAGAKVFLGDAGGQLVVGTEAGVTDAQGRYRLTAPRAGRYLVVVVGTNAAGKPVVLQTVTFQAGTDVAVNGASTCVAATLLAGHKGEVGQLDQAAFANAVGVVASKLTDDNHPDWSDPAAIATFTNGIAELKDILAGMRAQLDKIQQDLDTLKDQVGQLLNRSPEPTPTPSATPTTTPGKLAYGANGTVSAHITLTGKLKAKDDQPGKVELLLRSVNSTEKSDSGITYQYNKETKPTALGTVGEDVSFDLGTIVLPCKFFLQGVRNDTLESYDAIKAKNPDEQQEFKLDVHDGQIVVVASDKTPQYFLLKTVVATVAP